MKKNHWKNWYQGKTILITGATSGIGLAMAHELADSCARLVLVGRNQELLATLPEKLAGQNHLEVIAKQCDLSEKANVAQLIKDVGGHYQIDVLINNAGFGFFAPLVDLQEDYLRSMVDVNITALCELSQAFAGSMKMRAGCGILNVGSVASFFPVPGSAMYGASKFFVRSFTEALACECARHHMHVCGLYPGVTYTDFLRRATKGKKPQWEKAMSAEEVAYAGLKGLAENKLRIIPGLSNRIKVFIANHAPIKFLLSRSRFND